MDKPKTLKQHFNEIIKNFNNSRYPQEYVIYGSAETFKQMDEAVSNLVWIMKNPRLGPEQKWHHGDGFYRVMKQFGQLYTFDIILLKSYVHSRVVKIATATQKQVFYSYSEGFNASMKFTPEEWQKLKPLSKWELLKIFPHLSDRIKHLHAYFAIMQFYPEYICEECIALLSLENKGGGWENHHYNKTCGNCKKRPVKVYARNALKPIGL